ncbi:family 78 glycoside hydrolase catalytic domain [Faecalicatena contorta]|uniref:family 78 glycoside hydrolase catalytic domain n=1 Tax=Faecalicatena contorta TaxID=39482 RepID=UPI00189AFC8D|nr:family 78 glycoside hydrolase catalytic domain [Faecalicatena contorta]
MIKIIDCHHSYSENNEFSWKISGDTDQAAYCVQIQNRMREIVWNSGKVESENRHNVPCTVQLEKEEKYNWSVECWGTDGSADRIEGKTFYSGIDGWEAEWIEPNRTRKPMMDSTEPVEPVGRGERVGDALERLDPVVYMRKCFNLDKIPEYGVIYATARGIYHIWVNGVRVSNLFAPGNTSYNKHIDYQCYDVTKVLKTGENVIAIALADGWYTGKIGAVGIGRQFGEENAVLWQLICKDKEKNKLVYYSDESMKWSYGALRYADLYIGEYYDAGMELIGWKHSGFDDSEWYPVNIRKYGYQELELQSIPDIKETRTIEPKVIRTEKNEILLDAGENIVGYISFELQLQKGQIISFEHSETVDKDGNYLQNIIGQNKDQADYYKADRNGIAKWKPQFTYHGFRYVRVNGTDDRHPKHYQIHVIETPMRKTADFTCSDERLNTLQENIYRSQQGNMISIPTDCPQRERVGWTGDMQVYAPTACYEADVEQFLRHWMRDVQNEQLEDGQVPHIVPCMPSHDIMKPAGIKGVSAAGWSDAAVIVPWRLYQAYGDIRILEENYELMSRYMKSTENCVAEIPDNFDELTPQRQAVQKYLWNTGFQYGDWLMPSIQMSGGSIFEVVQQTGYVMATLMFALTTQLMSEICTVLGKEEEAKHYQELNEKVKHAFNVEYVNEDGLITKDYQGVYVLALWTDALPEKLRGKALEHLIQLIHDNNDLLDTGFLSVAYLLPVLQKMGRSDIANMLLMRDQCPSWLYEVKMGATTMWEYWNGYAEDGTPGDCSMNHFAFGCVGEYLYRTILGIQAENPGFKRMKIKPDVTCGLSYAKGYFESIWGKVEVHWKKKEGGYTLDVAIPPNTTAEVEIGRHKGIYGCGTYHIETES